MNMKLLLAGAAALAFANTAHAQSSLAFPSYNPPAYCRNVSYGVSTCLDLEYAARSKASNVWPSLPIAVQRECTDAGNIGGSYNDLNTCVKGHRGES